LIKLDLATISFNQTWPIVYQIRLLEKYLTDPYELSVYDDSAEGPAIAIDRVCSHYGARYMRVPGTPHLQSATQTPHAKGLNYACQDLLYRGAPYIGFLDHDVFPTRKTSLIKLAKPGFFGVGQRHGKSQLRYLWPGLCVFSKKWLAGRVPDFGGIEEENRRHNGDTGSMLSQLFTEADWEKLPWVKYGYLPIRPEDGGGTQSWCIEEIGDWIHLGNVSGWKDVPNPNERTEIVKRMVDELWTK
jgi:hypothetical protein